MKKKFNIMLCTLIGVLSACNEYDFDQEQYRNEVGLLSNSSLIYDRQVANVGQEKDTIYLVATVSGSQISPNTHHVALLESDSLLKAYNKSNFDIEKEKFAKLLPDECYDFPNKELDIQAGTSKVMFPIYLKNLERISPDSIYFLDYKIDPKKTPNYNPDKSHVLEVDPVDVVQLTPIDDYDNTFLLNAIRTPDGRATYYKEFRLHYKYRLESTAPYREVKAKLRYEFNPRVDNL